MKFLIAVYLPASPFFLTSPFINFGDFCQPSRLLQFPCLLFWPKFASLPVYSSLPFYLKLKSTVNQPLSVILCMNIQLLLKTCQNLLLVIGLLWDSSKCRDWKYKIFYFQFHTRHYMALCLVSLLLNPMFWIKRDITITHLSLHILTLTTEFDEQETFERMMTSLIPDIHTGKPSSKRFQLRFSAHNKKLIKSNKNKSFRTKNFNFGKKVTPDCCGPNETLTDPKDWVTPPRWYQNSGWSSENHGRISNIWISIEVN